MTLGGGWRALALERRAFSDIWFTDRLCPACAGVAWACVALPARTLRCLRGRCAARANVALSARALCALRSCACFALGCLRVRRLALPARALRCAARACVALSTRSLRCLRERVAACVCGTRALLYLGGSCTACARAALLARAQRCLRVHYPTTACVALPAKALRCFRTRCAAGATCYQQTQSFSDEMDIYGLRR